MEKYYKIEGMSSGGDYHFKVYKVKVLKSWTAGSYKKHLVEAEEPMFGTFFGMRKGQQKEVYDADLLDTLKETTDWAKKTVMQLIFTAKLIPPIISRPRSFKQFVKVMKSA